MNKQGKGGISYLTHTWNPLAMRCTPVSAGCANCWHLSMADRIAANPKLSQQRRDAYMGTGPAVLYARDRPLDGNSGRVIGVQFMGDLFHDLVPNESIDDIFGTMRLCSQDTFLVLTKRPERMVTIGELVELGTNSFEHLYKHVWMGVTAENQRFADERIPFLLSTPASRRWISLEPLLGPIDLYPAFCSYRYASWGWGPDSHWVTIGCESGPRRRPMETAWAVDIVRQCKDSGVPVYVKQVEVNGKVSKNPNEWPEELRVRELLW